MIRFVATLALAQARRLLGASVCFLSSSFLLWLPVLGVNWSLRGKAVPTLYLETSYGFPPSSHMRLVLVGRTRAQVAQLPRDLPKNFTVESHKCRAWDSAFVRCERSAFAYMCMAPQLQVAFFFTKLMDRYRYRRRNSPKSQHVT